MRDVVASRLGRLTESQRGLLTTAAVIGLTFDLDVLTAAVGGGPGAVLDDLEEVVRVALVNELDAGRFTFAHAFVRATLLERLSATRAALAHRQIAESIVSLDRADFDELALHWRLAGDDDQAAENLALAARRDHEALAHESAVERYEAVLRHHRATAVPDLAAIGRAHLGIGLGRRALGDLGYIADIEDAGRVGRKLRNADLVIDAAMASVLPGNLFITASETRAELVELNEDALELMATDDPRRTRVLTALASHLSFDADRGRRVALLAEAHELASAIGDPEVIGNVLVAEFVALWDPSTLDRRVAVVRQLARMARASSDADLEFFAGFFTALVDAERGDLDRARTELDSLAGPVAATHNFYFGFLVDRLRVSIDLYLGVPDVQDRIDALAVRYEETYADTAGTWAIQTGGRLLQGGRLGDLVEQLHAVASSRPGPNLWPAYGLALLQRGDRAAALAVLDSFEEPSLDYFWLTTMQVLAELIVALDRADDAERLFGLLYPYREQIGITASGSLCFGLVATTLGALATCAGRRAEAVVLLEHAVARADQIGSPFESNRARQLLDVALGSPEIPSEPVGA